MSLPFRQAWALVGLLCSCSPAKPISVSTPSSASAPGPTAQSSEVHLPRRTAPLVVSIVVDQLPSWMFHERVPSLPSSGGFHRLIAMGMTVEDLRMPHACSDTAPGHAMLFTGAPPRDSGIVSNEVPRSLEQRDAFVLDRTSRILGPDGQSDRPGASLASLQVATVADSLREAHPNAVIVSVSRKDRGALFGGGRRPTASLWYDSAQAAFVTSTALASAYPTWLGDRSRTRLKERGAWTLLDEAWVRSLAHSPDDQPGEGEFAGLGLTFPHLLPADSRAAKAYIATPWVDEDVAAIGLKAVANLRRANEPMLLSLSFSATDSIGHVFGVDSWESWDNLKRLDRTLGILLDELDRMVGKGAYDVMLASDHGAAGLPELAVNTRLRPWCFGGPPDRWGRPCGVGTRIDQDKLGELLDQESRKLAGPGNWILGMADPYVHLSPAANALPKPKRDALLARLATLIEAQPGVLRAFRSDSLGPMCPPVEDESLEALVCRSVRPGVSGDLYVVPKSGSFFDPDYVRGKGSSHGTTGVYDRSVPMLVVAPGKVLAGATVRATVWATSYARTLAELLGVEPPPGARSAQPLLHQPMTTSNRAM